MRVLFVHKHCPGQYAHLARALAADPRNEVVFVAEAVDQHIEGMRIVQVAPARRSGPPTHHYLQSFENAVLLGQAAYRAFVALRRDGFLPDLAYAHAGFGPGLYVKDAFPDAPLIGYFEWYYRARGGDAEFLNNGAIIDDEALRIRTRNAPLLLELAACDRGTCPTRFQRDQFPAEFHSKLSVIHDGVDTDYFRPARRGQLALTTFAPDPENELVTYAARGLEPYRGFPQFMRALAMVLGRRKAVHAVVLGEDRCFYGRPREDERSWKDAMLAELPDLDLSRVHFLGRVDYDTYRRVLQASHAHVYLTVPFVLSWSLIEAVATGCTIVGSDTAPVREAIVHGETGLLTPFHDPEVIAERIESALDDANRALVLGAAARRHALENYALDRLLPRHLDLAAATIRPTEMTQAS
jgi:glycosyltransferase involved in cell wall biosynthesis